MSEIEQRVIEGEDIMVHTPYGVFTLPLQPSGLSSGPRFVVHMPGPEQPAAVVAVGFRYRMKGLAEGCEVGDWNYIYHRAPDSFELRECEIETVYAGTLAQQPASAAGVEGWFLPASSINSLQCESVDAQIKRCKAAHFTNLDIRINGQNEAHEADWIKHMVKFALPAPLEEVKP